MSRTRTEPTQHDIPDAAGPPQYVPDTARLEQAAHSLAGAAPIDVLRWAFDAFDDRLVIATGFGAEGVALIDMAVRLRPDPHIFFLDTGFLFPETLELRDRLERRYGIRIRGIRPALTPEQQADRYGPHLWATQPDQCCRLRKLEPLRIALEGYDAWVTGIRRDQTADRAEAREVGWDARWQRVKVNPVVGWTRKEVWRYLLEHDAPYNPLHDQGYPSIGCTHCTLPVLEGEDERAGRWKGIAKTECGLHSRARSTYAPGPVNEGADP